MKEFIGYLLGNQTIWYYLAALVFSSIAIIISMWMGSSKRNVSSDGTPVGYSWRFLLWDNTKRFFVGLLVMFLIYRFTSTIVGKAMSMEMAVGVGFFVSMGLDQAIGYLKQKFAWLQMDREKIMEALKK